MGGKGDEEGEGKGVDVNQSTERGAWLAPPLLADRSVSGSFTDERC